MTRKKFAQLSFTLASTIVRLMEEYMLFRRFVGEKQPYTSYRIQYIRQVTDMQGGKQVKEACLLLAAEIRKHSNLISVPMVA